MLGREGEGGGREGEIGVACKLLLQVDRAVVNIAFETVVGVCL